MHLSTARMYNILSIQKELVRYPHLAINISFTQVSSCKMELVLQYLSAHAFIMALHTHKDTFCSKDAAFGEVTTEKAWINYAHSLDVFS